MTEAEKEIRDREESYVLGVPHVQNKRRRFAAFKKTIEYRRLRYVDAKFVGRKIRAPFLWAAEKQLRHYGVWAKRQKRIAPYVIRRIYDDYR